MRVSIALIAIVSVALLACSARAQGDFPQQGQQGQMPPQQGQMPPQQGQMPPQQGQQGLQPAPQQPMPALPCGPQKQGRSCRYLYGTDQCCSTWGQCGVGWYYCGLGRCLSGPCEAPYAPKAKVDEAMGKLQTIQKKSDDNSRTAIATAESVGKKIDTLYQQAIKKTEEVQKNILEAFQKGTAQANQVNEKVGTIHQDVVTRVADAQKRVNDLSNVVTTNNDKQTAQLKAGFKDQTAMRKAMMNELAKEQAHTTSELNAKTDRLNRVISKKIAKVFNRLTKELDEENARSLKEISRLGGFVSKVDQKIQQESIDREMAQKNMTDEINSRNQVIDQAINELKTAHSQMTAAMNAEIVARRSQEKQARKTQEEKYKFLQSKEAENIRLQAAQFAAQQVRSAENQADAIRKKHYDEVVNANTQALGLPVVPSFKN